MFFVLPSRSLSYQKIVQGERKCKNVLAQFLLCRAAALSFKPNLSLQFVIITSPGGAAPCLTACEVSAANVACGSVAPLKSGFGDAALNSNKVRHLRSRILGGQIPQVSFAVAHSTSRLSMVLPFQGNSTSSNEVVVTYKL